MKKLIFHLLYWSGVVRLAAWFNRRQVMILCYHGVTERTTRHPQDTFGLHVRQDRFAEHLRYLSRRYHVISLPHYLTLRSQQQPFPKYSVVLTFDDGYRNFFSAAAPRLLATNMPACIFLITDRMRDDRSLRKNTWSESDDESWLSWTEIDDLKSRGFNFGSHTCSHARLPELSPDELDHELSDSKNVLANRLQTQEVPFAYPYGLTSEAVIIKARALHYACALTTDTGFNHQQTDLFRLHRTLIGDDDDLPAFATRVSGLTRWLSRGVRH